MQKELLTIENLLSWQEVFNFAPKNYCFGYELLKRVYLKKSQIDDIVPNIQSYLHERLIQKFPDFPFREDYFDYYFIIRENEKNAKSIFIDMNSFFRQIVSKTTNQKIEERYLDVMFDVFDSDLKEIVIGQLQKNKTSINKIISDDFECGHNTELNIKKPIIPIINTTKEVLFAKRKMAVWVIRHYDELYSFLSESIDFRILENISKDKLLLAEVAFSLSKSGILNSGKITVNLDSLNYVNEYSLLVDYLNQENGTFYSCNFPSYLSDGGSFLITSDAIINEFKQFCVDYHDYIEDYPFATTYEEVLQKRALVTWKRIQSERYAKNIKLNFEMIQSGKKITLSNYQTGSYVKKTSNSEERQAKLKHAYDILEEKLEYYPQTKPCLEVVGMNTFTGYFANVYPNGVVVLDKLYKRFYQDKNGKSVIVPAMDEAIYVINYTEFFDLCRYTKSELIQEITQYQNPNVDRIPHTKNWRKSVDEWLDGPGFGELDYEIFDQLVSNLKEDSKVLRK